MSLGGLLRPFVTVLTWPAPKFADLCRTWDVALPPSDARAVVRGALGTDPLYMDALEGMAASSRSMVVGTVDDDGRLVAYVSGKRSSGMGLLGSVSSHGPGSRVEVRVGRVGLQKWFMPFMTLLMPMWPGMTLYHALTGADSGLVAAEAAVSLILTGGWAASLHSSGVVLRDSELPRMFEALDRVLAPHRRPTGAQ